MRKLKVTAAVFLLFVCWFAVSAPSAMSQQPQYCDENNPLTIRFEGFDEFGGFTMRPEWWNLLENKFCTEEFRDNLLGKELVISHKYLEDVPVWWDLPHIVGILNPNSDEMEMLPNVGGGATVDEAVANLFKALAKQ